VLQKECVPPLVDLLRQVIARPLEDIRKVLQDASAGVTAVVSSNCPDEDQASSCTISGSAVSGPSLSIKKAEELIVSKLWMIEKSLRGAAEILCDTFGEEPKTPVLSTCRDELLACLGDGPEVEDSRRFLTTIRMQVAKFLQYFQEEMQALSGLATHPLASLKNNLTIQKLWSQLFNLLVTRRMSCLKDVDNIRQVSALLVEWLSSS